MTIETAIRKDNVMHIVGFEDISDSGTFMGVPLKEYTYYELIRILRYMDAIANRAPYMGKL